MVPDEANQRQEPAGATAPTLGAKSSLTRHGTPSADTFRRVFEALPPPAYHEALLRWARPLLDSTLATGGHPIVIPQQAARQNVPELVRLQPLESSAEPTLRSATLLPLHRTITSKCCSAGRNGRHHHLTNATFGERTFDLHPSRTRSLAPAAEPAPAPQ